MSCKDLDIYLSKLPSDPIVKDNFCLQPILKDPEYSEQPQFSGTAVGRNSLGYIVQDMCEEDNILGNKTNHSLCATGASNMFQKIIHQWTGHHSLTGLRNYEHTTIQQQEAVLSYPFF